MNVIFETVVDRPVENLKGQIETISAFRWHYYLVVLLFLLMFSSIITTVCARQAEEADKIRSTPNAAVQCLQQINSLISCLKK
jgi:hypothetical protein